MTNTATVQALRDRAAKAMRDYMAADKSGPQRSIATEEIARTLAEVREHFYDREGNADLTGRSYEYRLFVKGAMDDASVPKEDRTPLMASVRYRISPILHERHGDELVERGLTQGSTRDRARERRLREVAVLRVFSGGGPITDIDDAELAANLARVAFERIQAPEDADADDIERVAAAFTRTAKAAREASRRVSTPR